MLDVNKKAKELNVRTEGKSRTDLIRSIQKAEGNFDCFGKARNFCDQGGCAWRPECLHPVTGTTTTGTTPLTHVTPNFTSSTNTGKKNGHTPRGYAR